MVIVIHDNGDGDTRQWWLWYKTMVIVILTPGGEKSEDKWRYPWRHRIGRVELFLEVGEENTETSRDSPDYPVRHASCWRHCPSPPRWWTSVGDWGGHPHLVMTLHSHVTICTPWS